MGNPIVTEQFARLFDKRLREVSEGGIKEIDSKIPTFFKMLDSESAFEEFFEVGAVPDIPEFVGQLEYLAISPGFHTKIEHKTYAGGLKFEPELLEDKKYSVFESAAESLGQSAARVKEKLGVRPFTYATSATFDFMTSEEGVALASSSHTTKSGVSTSSGFSNAGTSALNPTNVAATRLSMRRFRNDIGERIEIEPDALVVPDALADKAGEIVGTDKGLWSAEGTKNMQQGRFKVLPWLRLDDSDTNNWGMVDTKLMKKFLAWFDRVLPDTKTTIDFETFIVKHSIRLRCSYGWTNWRWIYWNTVS